MDIDDLLNTPKFESLKRYLDDQLFSYTSDETRFKLMEIFGEYHKARDWYYSKLQALGDKRPYDLCLEGKEKKVYDELINIEHGSLC
ncbi:MAG: antitoxin Xre/MbcA/ParS toxin-binding domain-containing protein [Candidatus Woesearchaeota archaeon]